MVAGIGYTQSEATSQSASELLITSPILMKMSQDLQPVLIEDVFEEPMAGFPGLNRLVRRNDETVRAVFVNGNLAWSSAAGASADLGTSHAFGQVLSIGGPAAA